MRKQRRCECKGCYQQCPSTHVQLLGSTVCKTLLWNNALYKYPAKRILNRSLISSVIWEGWVNTAGPLMWAERFNMRHRKNLISTSSFRPATYICHLKHRIHQNSSSTSGVVWAPTVRMDGHNKKSYFNMRELITKQPKAFGVNSETTWKSKLKLEEYQKLLKVNILNMISKGNLTTESTKAKLDCKIHDEV